eukprot:588739-Pyramimonas_sp.AAC.1
MAAMCAGAAAVRARRKHKHARVAAESGDLVPYASTAAGKHVAAWATSEEARKEWESQPPNQPHKGGGGQGLLEDGKARLSAEEE